MEQTTGDSEAAEGESDVASAPLLNGDCGETTCVRSLTHRIVLVFIPAAAMALGVAVAFHPLLLHPGALLVGPQHNGNNDLTAYFLASRSFAGQTSGQFGGPPLWNPYLLSGAPFVGNPQSAWLYPPNWVYYVLRDATPAVSCMLALHHFWAACGVYLVCRQWGLSYFAASAGGALLACAPYWLAHVGEGHYNQICAVAWIPWAIWAYERLRERGRGGVALVAVVLALSFFAGHAQETFYLALALTAAAAVDGSQLAWQKKGAEARRLVGSWILVGLATLGLAAIELAPIGIYSRLSVRGGGMTAREAGIGLEGANLLQLVCPWALGGPVDHHQRERFFWETVCYFGVVPLVVGAVGVVADWRRRAVQWSIWLFAAGLVFAFGSAGPLFPLLYRVVPGISLFRVPSRALFLCAVAAAILAAVGFDVVVKKLGAERREADKRKWVLRLALVGLWFLCLVELGLFSHGVLRTVPIQELDAVFPIAALAEANDERVLAEQSLVSDGEAQRLGLQKVQAYEPAPLAHYAAYVDAMALNGDPAQLLLGYEQLDLRTLHKPVVDLLGVRYAVVSSPPAEAVKDWRLISQGWRDAEFALQERPRKHAYLVFENATPGPRAFVVGQVRTIPAGGDESHALRQIDPRREVLLSADVLPSGQRTAFRPAQIVEHTPNWVTVEAILDHPGYLVVTDVWYPGWRATVDGKPASVLRADVAFRAVALPAGSHRVEFSYQTPGLMLGGLITAGTVIALALGAAKTGSSRTM